MVLSLLLAALIAAAEPPPDWSYYFEQADAVIAGEEASALGAKALGQIGADTVRIESSHYGIAAFHTLNFYQQPRPDGRLCAQTIYQVEAVRTRAELRDLPKEVYLRAEASGDGYRLDQLEIWRRFARQVPSGGCAEATAWTRAQDRQTYDAVMLGLEQVRFDHRAQVAEFLKEPVRAVQRRGDVLTAETDTRRLIMEVGVNTKLKQFRFEDKGPPPLS